ncbi:MAG: GIY-YIG nuclease family protein [Bacteroidota bacterium]
MTNDIDRRVKQHNNKQNTSTKFYAPFILVHFEKFDTRIEARNREKYLKSGVGKEFLKSL